MDIVTVSPKFQIVIPKRIREAMELKPGEKISMTERNGIIRMVRLRDFEEFAGAFPDLRGR